jgi:hypothetical protein
LTPVTGTGALPWSFLREKPTATGNPAGEGPIRHGIFRATVAHGQRDGPALREKRLRPAAPPVRGQYDTGFFVQRWRTVNVTGRHCVKNRQPRRVRLPVLFLQCCFAPVCAPGCLEWSG